METERRLPHRIRIPGWRPTAFHRGQRQGGRVSHGDRSRNQILNALNKPEQFILAVVEVEGETAHEPRCVRHPFEAEAGFATVSVSYDLGTLMRMGTDPS